jgi:hypothetical protein
MSKWTKLSDNDFENEFGSVFRWGGKWHIKLKGSFGPFQNSEDAKLFTERVGNVLKILAEEAKIVYNR